MSRGPGIIIVGPWCGFGTNDKVSVDPNVKERDYSPRRRAMRHLHSRVQRRG